MRLLKRVNTDRQIKYLAQLAWQAGTRNRFSSAEEFDAWWDRKCRQAQAIENEREKEKQRVTKMIVDLVVLCFLGSWLAVFPLFVFLGGVSYGLGNVWSAFLNGFGMACTLSVFLQRLREYEKKPVGSHACARDGCDELVHSENDKYCGTTCAEQAEKTKNWKKKNGSP